jgi:hypothetical protein
MTNVGNVEFKDKFVAFVDILGFKKMVEAAEAGIGMSLPELLDMLKELGKPEDQERIKKHGPVVCPQSAFVQRDLDFQLTQISDCMVASYEISPAGVINLIGHCWGALIQLLTKGIMYRGYITRGPVYHDDTQVIGTGYQEAYRKEAGVTAFIREADERGTPFVEVDQVVCDYVADYGDKCVKEMFSRYVKKDGDTTALFPFQRLAHSFIVAGFGHTFDPEKEKRANENLRQMIQNVKRRVTEFVDDSNPSAVSKANHYLASLDVQLEGCDKTGEAIDMLCSSFPRSRPKY